MKLGLAQIQIEGAKGHRNRQRATEAIREAADRGCDLVCLPEMFTVGYFAFDSYSREAEPIDGETINQLQDIATEEQISILAGSFVEDLEASTEHGFETPADEGYANTAVYIDAAGRRRAIYRKQHLFGYQSAEQQLLTPGQSVPTVEDEGFTIGITTCYDLRFPELYRSLVESEVTLTLVPSAWPYPRVEHWETLPKARAIENLMYVAAANGVGEFDEAALVGRSTVYDPWGTPIASAGERAGLVMAELDPDGVGQRREEFPALADRRDSY
ncbi:nitrilase-related carbon-nitrogen hydrolase [Halobacteriaceae archaeon SHR40]|uniref:nitrilase-related carbon-nitrogen hydrolase n=1 Tax=Halovenus amylolytica TaxID=2500550 RepID=UPI000FE33A01